jgi:hypothetical protein
MNGTLPRKHARCCVFGSDYGPGVTKQELPTFDVEWGLVQAVRVRNSRTLPERGCYSSNAESLKHRRASNAVVTASVVAQLYSGIMSILCIAVACLCH